MVLFSQNPMAETRKSPSKQPTPADKGNLTSPKPLGRKRDHQRDQVILDAALLILAESGFDAMTMDQVAARAKAGKATLYRRWPSKGELVRDALIGMSRNSIEVDRLPDTGNLRDDLLGVMKPYPPEYTERKMKVLSGLGSFSVQHPALYDEALAGIFKPWVEINTSLIARAIRRGELPPGADAALTCELIVAVTAFRTSIQRKPFEKADYRKLLDKVLLPALKASNR